MGRQRVKVNPDEKFGLTRDGELIGTGLTREEVTETQRGYSESHPESLYQIVSHPKIKKGKKVNP